MLLVLMQALVFNHIHLFDYAMPLPYVYFLLLLPTDTPRWAYLLLGFFLGLAVDLFSSTPGMTSASMCFTALLMPTFISLFAPSDLADEAFVPSLRTMEWTAYLRLATSVVLVNTFAYFFIEAFTFEAWEIMLLGAGGSSVLTLLFVFAMDYISNGRRRH